MVTPVRHPGGDRRIVTEGEIGMGEQVVVSLGVEDLERAKQFFCEGLGFELERAEGPFAAFKESRGRLPSTAVSRSPTKSTSLQARAATGAQRSRTWLTAPIVSMS
jgi:hypothetical protein